MLTDNLDKTDTLINFFLQVSNLADSKTELPDNARLFDIGTGFETIEITLEDVFDETKCLDCAKSDGLDGIPPVLMKEGVNILVSVLYRHYSVSYSLFFIGIIQYLILCSL